MRPIDTPIYDELAEHRGIHIPFPLESDPVHALLAAGARQAELPVAVDSAPALAALSAGEVTQWLPVIRQIDPDRMPAEEQHAHGGGQ